MLMKAKKKRHSIKTKKKKKNTKKKIRRRQKRQRLLINSLIILVLITNILTLPYKINYRHISLEKIIIKSIRKEQKNKKRKQCLSNRTLSTAEKEKLSSLVNDLNDYLNQYNIGFKYKEQNYDYEISFDSDKEFYGRIKS